MNRYLVKLLIATVALLAVLFGLSFIEEPKIIHAYAYYMVVFMSFLVFFSHQLHQKGLNDQDPQQFTMFFMGGLSAKMLIALLVITVFLFVLKDEKVAFAMNFLAIYFYYTIFEVVTLLTILKRKKADIQNV